MKEVMVENNKLKQNYEILKEHEMSIIRDCENRKNSEINDQQSLIHVEIQKHRLTNRALGDAFAYACKCIELQNTHAMQCNATLAKAIFYADCAREITPLSEHLNASFSANFQHLFSKCSAYFGKIPVPVMNF